jgi:hypothetical protein
MSQKPDDDGTIIGPLGATPTPPNSVPAPPADCPSCGAPLDANDDPFCQSCGARVGSVPTAAQQEAYEKPRPWFPLVVALWLLIMVAALYFVYSHALVVGST